uniref:Uncharacterized protein n=1 Tax=mine drainage metagenome TaxID=410659 RepID=E6PKT3_9ZZZZ
MTRSKAKPDDPEQSRRFIEAARNLEADESGREFNEAIGSRVLGSKGAPSRELPPPNQKKSD